MKKLASNLPNMVGVLLVVCLISSASLTFVHDKTAPRIAAVAAAKELAAIQKVLPEGYDNNPKEDSYNVALETGEDLTVYPAIKNGKAKAYAVKTWSAKGYAGMIRLMVSYLPDGTVHAVDVLGHQETPGLGTKMDEPAFKEQVIGANPLKKKLAVTKDGGQIDAITAATISSRAFLGAVTRGVTAVKEAKK